MGLIYLDSCIVIDLLEGERPRADQLTEALSGVDGAVVSPLVYLECEVVPTRERDELVVAHYERFLDGCVLAPIDLAVCRRAARLRATLGLRTPDAIHAAAAIESGCDSLWTNDERLARALSGFAAIV